MYDTKKIRQIALLFGLFCLGLIAVGIIQFTRGIGKIQVSINTLPNDASISIDGKPVKNGDFVTSGEHVFTAKKNGFADRTSRLIITKEEHIVTLPLTPQSDEAKKWANAPENQAKYSAMGSTLASEQGLAIRTANPLINQLPYTDVTGPFQINFGFPDPNNRFKLFYSIDYGSPIGRRKALEWIKSQGVDPTTLDIRFSDYKNPLTGGVE